MRFLLGVLCVVFLLLCLPNDALARNRACSGGTCGVTVTVPVVAAVVPEDQLAAVGGRMGWWWSKPTPPAPKPVPTPAPAPVVAPCAPAACTPADTVAVDAEGGRRHPVARIVVGVGKGVAKVVGVQRRHERRAGRHQPE